jgi:26S proteasome non-ATPase regulatory subunit 10
MSSNESLKKPVLVRPTAGERGMAALHYAAYLNDPDAVRDQLNLGIAVDVRDDNGWTPLHWSIDMAEAWGEAEKVVALLIRAGASVDAADRSGFSVLMMACGRNNEAILNQLIDAGADIHARNAHTAPLHEAAGCNFSQGIRRLLSLGANPLETDSRGHTAEHIAEVCGFDECVAILKAARLNRDV